MRNLADTKVGKVNHFYDKIGVAVVDILAPIKVGQRIKIGEEDSCFVQEVSSMQIEHEQITTAKKGQMIGLKVDKPVKKGDTVYKVK